MGVNIVALIWGIAEASFFFIVPDVWLSIIAAKNLKKGLVACCCALAGALIGGSLIYLMSKYSAIDLLEFYKNLPAINHSLILSVQEMLNTDGLTAILLAPLAGIPYKLFAAQANTAGISLAAFLLISIPARLIRFIAVAGFAHLILKLIDKTPLKLNKTFLLISFWILFYIFYLYSMSS